MMPFKNIYRMVIFLMAVIPTCFGTEYLDYLRIHAPDKLKDDVYSPSVAGIEWELIFANTLHLKVMHPGLDKAVFRHNQNGDLAVFVNTGSELSSGHLLYKLITDSFVDLVFYAMGPGMRVVHELITPEAIKFSIARAEQRIRETTTVQEGLSKEWNIWLSEVHRSLNELLINSPFSEFARRVGWTSTWKQQLDHKLNQPIRVARSGYPVGLNPKKFLAINEANLDKAAESLNGELERLANKCLNLQIDFQEDPSDCPLVDEFKTETSLLAAKRISSDDLQRYRIQSAPVASGGALDQTMIQISKTFKALRRLSLTDREAQNQVEDSLIGMMNLLEDFQKRALHRQKKRIGQDNAAPGSTKRTRDLAAVEEEFRRRTLIPSQTLSKIHKDYGELDLDLLAYQILDNANPTSTQYTRLRKLRQATERLGQVILERTTKQNQSKEVTQTTIAGLAQIINAVLPRYQAAVQFAIPAWGWLLRSINQERWIMGQREPLVPDRSTLSDIHKLVSSLPALVELSPQAQEDELTACLTQTTSVSTQIRDLRYTEGILSNEVKPLQFVGASEISLAEVTLIKALEISHSDTESLLRRKQEEVNLD
ncbi:MAG: hypothetical protein LBJ92_03385 [Holosporales bacterium]|nr:hypothetical protein [Holosporales bacterium]